MKFAYVFTVLKILAVSTGSEALPSSANFHPDLSVLWKFEDVGIIKDAAELTLELEMHSGCDQVSWESGSEENVVELCEQFFQESIVSVMKEACDNTEASWNSSGTHLEHLPIRSSSEFSTVVSFINDVDLVESPHAFHTKGFQFNLNFAQQIFGILIRDIKIKVQAQDVQGQQPAAKNLVVAKAAIIVLALLKLLKHEKTVACEGDCAMDLAEPYSCKYSPNFETFLFKVIIPRISVEEKVLTAKTFKIRMDREVECGSGASRNFSCDGVYNGPTTVVYNTVDQCIRGTAGLLGKGQQHIFDRELSKSCQDSQAVKKMGNVQCDEKLREPELQVHRDESGNIFIYCFGANIIINGASQECPNEVISLDGNISFQVQRGDIIHAFENEVKIEDFVRKPPSSSARDFFQRELQPCFTRKVDEAITQQCELVSN